MSNNIDTTCGIYKTAAKVVFHRNGSATVRAPYIRWDNNTGVLNFRKILVTNQHHVAILRDLSNNDDAGMGYGELISHYA